MTAKWLPSDDLAPAKPVGRRALELASHFTRFDPSDLGSAETDHGVASSYETLRKEALLNALIFLPKPVAQLVMPVQPRPAWKSSTHRRATSTFSSDIARPVSPGVGEVASLPPAPEKPRRSGLREAEKGDYRDHKHDDQDEAEGVHLPGKRLSRTMGYGVQGMVRNEIATPERPPIARRRRFSSRELVRQPGGSEGLLIDVREAGI
jgi:hypothetical protein